jgi:mono/diheme cytochrome c family protein
MARRRIVVLVILWAIALTAALGCTKNDAAPAPVPLPGPKVGAPDVPAQFVAARKTFDKKCANCHSLGAPAAGAEPDDLLMGGDLAKVAADPLHTREWIINYVRDAKAQNPKSRMPRFADKLNDQELAALADYLASLK